MKRFLKLGCTPNNPQEDYSGMWCERKIVALGWNDDLGPLESYRLTDGTYDERKLAEALSGAYDNPSTATAKAREIKLFAEAGANDVFVVMNGKRLLGMVDQLGPNEWDPKMSFGHYRKGRWILCFKQDEKLVGKFETKLRTCAEFSVPSHIRMLNERYESALADALPFKDVHCPVSGSSGFERYLELGNTPGSRKASSYKTVVQNLSPILKKIPRFSELPDDFCEITNLDDLREIYEKVLAEQKKVGGGIFHGTKLTRGYWEKNFCSAAVRNFINFRVLQSHTREAQDIFETATSGEEVARKVAALKIPDAKKYVFENSAEERLVGKERVALVTTRANQGVFRNMVRDNYSGTCCISGLELLPTLEAAHISPWDTDKKNRLNPANGLFMNVMYHRAFDAHLIGFDKNLKLVLSKSLKEEMTSSAFNQFFRRFEGKPIRRPHRYAPDMSLLAKHLEKLV